ncbi:MAG: DUF898 domain-containing protein [Alphaproteobacteria bacterium]|nr:DUF898 domain-containing protein [Alphaproteobacteria bacterium]MBL7096230.1 DUF898 domain-containing protein [Alphaproteobacteria bacterium]
MNAVWRAPETDVATTHAVEFRGTGREYFRVWLVNVTLTLLTLGLYGPWAKVRTRRYFYGVTSLAGHSFDYHAAPMRILLGRIVIAGVLFAGLVSLQLGRWAVAMWAIAAIAVFPLLVRQAIRFNARNTSWRGVRFNFHARYREALFACVLLPLAGLLTLFLLPAARGAWDRFRVNHLSFDGRLFRVEYSPARMFAIFATGFVLIVGVLVAMIGATMGVLVFTTRMHDVARHVIIPVDPTSFTQVFTLLFGTCAFFIAMFVMQMANNLTLSNTTIEGRHRIVSKPSPARVALILLGNAVLIALTLGLFWPFAKVRLARYRMSQISVIAQGDLDAFTAEALEMQSTMGRELSGLLEIGL